MTNKLEFEMVEEGPESGREWEREREKENQNPKNSFGCFC